MSSARVFHHPLALTALALAVCSSASGCGAGSGSTNATIRSVPVGTGTSGSTRAGGHGARQQPASRSSGRPAGAYVGSNAGGRPASGKAATATAPAPHTPQQRRDYAEVTATVRAVVAGVAAHDSSICTRLFTQHYVESRNGLKGAAAVSQCRQQVAGFRGTLKLVRIEQVRGNGRAATVQFVTTLDAKTTTQILGLVRSGGGWEVYVALRRVRRH